MPEVNEKLSLSGFGKKVFPANFFQNRIVGNDYILEFIYDDGSDDDGISYIGMSTKSGLLDIIKRSDELISTIHAEKKIPEIRDPKFWNNRKPLALDEPPFRFTHSSIGRLNDLVTISFAFVHPNILLNRKSPGEAILPVSIIAEVGLEYSQFTSWLNNLKELLAR